MGEGCPGYDLGPTQLPIQWDGGGGCPDYDLGPTQLPFQWDWGWGNFSPGYEADHLLLSNAKVKKMVELYLTPLYVFLAWCLIN
jgi:hypothetical protein